MKKYVVYSPKNKGYSINKVGVDYSPDLTKAHIFNEDDFSFDKIYLIGDEKKIEIDSIRWGYSMNGILSNAEEPTRALARKHRINGETIVKIIRLKDAPKVVANKPAAKKPVKKASPKKDYRFFYVRLANGGVITCELGIE